MDPPVPAPDRASDSDSSQSFHSFDSSHSSDSFHTARSRQDSVQQTILEEPNVEDGNVEDIGVDEPRVEEAGVKAASAEDASVKEAGVEMASVDQFSAEETGVEESNLEETDTGEGNSENVQPETTVTALDPQRSKGKGKEVERDRENTAAGPWGRGMEMARSLNEDATEGNINATSAQPNNPYIDVTGPSGQSTQASSSQQLGAAPRSSASD